MIELLTEQIEIPDTGVRIRLLPLGELLSLISGLKYYTEQLYESEKVSVQQFIKSAKKLKSFIHEIIKKASNIKRPRYKHYFIVEMILKINLGKEYTCEQTETSDSFEAIYRLIDLIASEYGWTDRYILSSLTLDKAQKLALLIRERKEKEDALRILGMAHAFHSPDGEYVKTLYQQLSGKKRKKIVNVKEYLENLKKEQTNG